jgi:hypothetical protein
LQNSEETVPKKAERMTNRMLYMPDDLWAFLDKRDGRRPGEQIRELVAKAKREEEATATRPGN